MMRLFNTLMLVLLGIGYCASINAVPISQIPCTVTYDSNCLKEAPKLISKDHERLLIARNNGNISVFNTITHAGFTISPEQPLPAADSVSGGTGTVWWTINNPLTLICFREPERQLKIYDLSQSGLSRIRDVIPWKGVLALLMNSGISFLDPETGEIIQSENVFPPDIASQLNSSQIYFLKSEKNTILASVKFTGQGSEIHLQDISGNVIMETGCVTLPQRLVSMTSTEGGYVSISSSGVTNLKIEDQLNLQALQTIDPQSWMGSGCSISSDSGIIWWTIGPQLFRYNIKTGETDAFLPWNENDLVPRMCVAIGSDAWVATNRDIRRVSLSKVDSSTGYSGFIRASLDAKEQQPTDSRLAHLSSLVEEWQETPYKWGGASRSGTDCSGFIMAVYDSLGIKLPHGSKNLLTCKSGASVKDILQYGDVLVMPGHAALYVGSGKTAETVRNKGVGYASIWNRSGISVKRFIRSDSPAPASVVKAKSPTITLEYAVRLIKAKDSKSLYGVLSKEPGLAKASDSSGTTLLHWAADRNDTAIIKTLISFGSQIEAKNRKGNTSLHIAASLGNSEAVKLLIKSGASVKVKDKNGRTPLDLAILHNKMTTAAIIGGISAPSIP